MGLTIKPPPPKHRVHMPPIVIPQIEYGVDWGRPRRLLAKRKIEGKEVLLFIVPGHSHWSGQGQPWVYGQTKLTLLLDARGYSSRDLAKGRMSKKVLEAAGPEIAEAFRLPHIMQLIALDRTVEVEPIA